MNDINSLIFKDLLIFSTKRKRRRREEKSIRVSSDWSDQIKELMIEGVWGAWIQWSVGRAHRQCGGSVHIFVVSVGSCVRRDAILLVVMRVNI